MKYDLIAEAYKKLLRESIEHPMIEVDGVMKHRHNSLGQPIHPTDEGIRNFHRWFGDSKTVDEHGRPMVLYHGTTKNFSEFDQSKLGDNTESRLSMLGSYFTPDSELAGKFTSGTGWVRKKEKFKQGSNILPTYITIKNPKILPGKDWTDLNAKSWLGVHEYKEYLQGQGYDGLIIKSWEGKDPTKELHVPQYVTFNSNQIKSTIGNNGNFSHPTKITESRFDTISSAYIRQINESIDITPIFNLHVDPTRYEITSQKNIRLRSRTN